MTRSIFDPATDEEIRQELTQMPREELVALAYMHILFNEDDPADSPGRLAFYRRREIARELTGVPPPSPRWSSAPDTE
jgi:hypothetical protein